MKEQGTSNVTEGQISYDKMELQHQQETRNCNENYHSLFEQATDAIMVTDFNGNFKDVNSSLCSMFGYSKEELLQLNVKALLDDVHLKIDPLRFDLLAAGETIFKERKMVHKNGVIVYVEANAKKFTDNLIMVIARDITERKKIEWALQKSEANLHTIFDTTDTIYVLMDNHLRIISYNPRAFDFAKNELGHNIEISEYFLDYFTKGKQMELLTYIQEVLTGRHISYEVSYPQPNGSSTWYYARMFPISKNDKNIYGLMMAVSDITEKKLLERKLLEQKVQEQKNIIRAVLKAEEIERNKIGQELHDNVNQILSGIRLYLDTLQQDQTMLSGLIQKSKESIDIAIKEIRLLSQRQVTPQKKFDLKELIEKLAIELTENTQASTKFYSNVADHLLIEEDLKLNIYRIVQEQMNNILKHASASTAIICIKENNGILQVSITDNGKGFDPLMKRKGIGISNMINRIDSYNGQIIIDSSLGNGCKIEITIPI